MHAKDGWKGNGAQTVEQEGSELRMRRAAVDIGEEQAAIEIFVSGCFEFKFVVLCVADLVLWPH